MPLPTKDEILARAKRIKLEDIVGKGLPALTPEDYELKESGAFHTARRQLMGQKSMALMQQRKYLDEMAGEMGLVVYARNYVKKLEKAQERLMKVQRKKPTNGNSLLYLAHAMKPRKIEPIDEKVISQYKGDPFPITRAELNQMKGSRALSREWTKFNRGVRFEMDRAKQRAKQKKPKSRKRRVQRSGKTMRRLRKRVKNGQKVFSFPDHVWKVRK